MSPSPCPRSSGFSAATTRFTFANPNQDEVDPIVSLFGCRVVVGELQNRDGEATEVTFFSPDEVPSELTPIKSYLLERLA